MTENLWPEGSGSLSCEKSVSSWDSRTHHLLEDASSQGVVVLFARDSCVTGVLGLGHCGLWSQTEQADLHSPLPVLTPGNCISQLSVFPVCEVVQP